MMQKGVVSKFDPSVLNMDKLVSDISSNSRLSRQKAASTFSKLARVEPERVLAHLDLLFAALDCKEARTKAAVLETLAVLSAHDSSLVEKVYDYAEEALFDDDDGSLRLMGMFFLCKAGAVNQQASLRAWPLIDEALQCFHGEPEFCDMLTFVSEYAATLEDSSIKEGLKSRLSFDAESSSGILRKRAQSILSLL